MVLLASRSKDSGRISRADLSSASPIAISSLVARILWSVRPLDWTRIVWPPETRMDRKGNSGAVAGGSALASFSRHDTSPGVKRCACMWCTPTIGICHATDSAFPVSRPTDRFDRIPGPLVADMKSGRRRRVPSASLSPSPVFDSGRWLRAFCTRFARLSWWDSRAMIGWIPRCSRVSAVTFSRKWILAALPESLFVFSTMATEVSSLLFATN